MELINIRSLVTNIAKNINSSTTGHIPVSAQIFEPSDKVILNVVPRNISLRCSSNSEADLLIEEI